MSEVNFAGEKANRVEISVSTAEVAAGTLTDSHRNAAVEALDHDGYVVLADVVSRANLDALHGRLMADLDALRGRRDAPYNWNTGNIQQDPPPFHPYLFADVLLNEQVIAVTQAVLGAGVKNRYYSGNTALPSESRQPVHADSTHLWPVLAAAHPPSELVVNIPTVDVTPENGGTEVWPGTHACLATLLGDDIKVPDPALERRRAVRPPVQMAMRRGSVLIRDVRLWHAGMPNRTSAPRPMIAMIHACRWLDTGPPLVFPADAAEFFRHPALRTCATFTDKTIDHISAPQAYEYAGS